MFSSLRKGKSILLVRPLWFLALQLTKKNNKTVHWSNTTIIILWQQSCDVATVLHDGEKLARNRIVILTGGLLFELQMSEHSEARALGKEM